MGATRVEFVDVDPFGVGGLADALGIGETEEMIVDTFTIRHLHEYAEVSVFEFEREAFIAYALDAIDQDPQLVEYGWPPLYRQFIYESDLAPKMAI